MPVLYSAQLHPVLSPLRHELALPSDGVLAGPELGALIDDLAARLPLHDLARHDPRQRWWVQLALTDAVEVFLIGWARGQSTGAHDHDGAHAAFSVVHGELREDVYDVASARRTDVRFHRSGRAAVLPADHAHDVRAETLATSIHAYSPPLRPTRPLSLA